MENNTQIIVKKTYEKPECQIIVLEETCKLLAGSNGITTLHNSGLG